MQEDRNQTHHFSKHNNMKLEINYRKKNRKITNVETKQYSTKTKWIMKKSKRKSENTLSEMKIEAQFNKFCVIQQK